MADRTKDTYLNREGLEYYHRKIKQEFASKDDLELKQDKLTSENAGEGIAITEDSGGNVIISNTQTSAEWGNITGNITNQTDLINYIHEHSGAINSISVNGVEQSIVDGNVDIKIKEDFGIIGIPFDSEGNISHSLTPDYFKYTLPEYINQENYYVSHYLSAEELIDIINNNNCYAVHYILYFFPSLQGFVRYSHWGDADQAVGGVEIPTTGLLNLSTAYFYADSADGSVSIQLTDTPNATLLDEVIGRYTSWEQLTPQQVYKALYPVGENGIVIRSAAHPSYNNYPVNYIGISPEIVFDCGSSTEVIYT